MIADYIQSYDDAVTSTCHVDQKVMFIFSMICQKFLLRGSPSLMLFFCLAELESLTGEWVLTDVADNSQRGTSERIREKMVKISQVVRDLEERVREAERRVSAGMASCNYHCCNYHLPL